MKTPRPSDAERPTPQASPMRDCRDSWPSLCDAVRRRPGRRRTRLFPFLPPGPAVSTARPTGFRQTRRAAAIENWPSCSWPCGARPRHLRQYVRELSFSIEHLHLRIGNPATKFRGFGQLLVYRRKSRDAITSLPPSRAPRDQGIRWAHCPRRRFRETRRPSHARLPEDARFGMSRGSRPARGSASLR